MSIIPSTWLMWRMKALAPEDDAFSASPLAFWSFSSPPTPRTFICSSSKFSSEDRLQKGRKERMSVKNHLMSGRWYSLPLPPSPRPGRTNNFFLVQMKFVNKSTINTSTPNSKYNIDNILPFCFYQVQQYWATTFSKFKISFTRSCQSPSSNYDAIEKARAKITSRWDTQKHKDAPLGHAIVP